MPVVHIDMFTCLQSIYLNTKDSYRSLFFHTSVHFLHQDKGKRLYQLVKIYSGFVARYIGNKCKEFS